MPNRWPIANGNWSDSAIWSGSLIPTPTDDVFTNNCIVYIDTDITIRSIRNSATGSAIASTAQANCFYLNDGVTLTTTTAGIVGDVTSISFIPTLIISGSNSARITGSISTQGGNYGCAIIMLDNSSLSITGSITGGTAGGGGTTSRIIYCLSSGRLNVSGSVSSGVNTVFGGTIFHAGIGVVNVVGNITGPTTGNNSGPAINNAGSGVMIVTGSILGGTKTTDNTITNSSIGTLIVSGGASAIGGPAVGSTTNGTVTVYGPVSSSISAVGVSSTGTTATNLFTGPFFNTGSFNAVYAYRMQMLEPTSTTWRFDTETAGVSKTLYTSNQLPGVPRENNVRKGTTYNFGLTGSLPMPDPTTVQLGVATDNTTGSAIMTPQDMFDVLTENLTTSGSIGKLLTEASTVQTVGATISSFKV
jgi:hypothetical protein